MRLHQLAAAVDLPVTSVKHHLREGLLPPGEKVNATTARCGEDHVQRLELIRELRRVVGMGTEDHRQAAVREVEEETGIAGDILEPLGSIDYWFTVSRHRVHKTVHHFLLRAVGGELTTENDPDHEAVDVAWVGIDDVARRLSFANERRIVDLARRILPQHFPGDHAPGRI